MKKSDLKRFVDSIEGEDIASIAIITKGEEVEVDDMKIGYNIFGETVIHIFPEKPMTVDVGDYR